MPHLLLAISGHGYGHLAQCAPVVNALQEKIPRLRLTVASSLPRTVLEDHLAPASAHLAVDLDPVLRMTSAWEVDVPASRQVFARFHRDWDAGIRKDIELLQGVSPDLVLGNIPYRIFCAAAALEIPAIALCSLNWAAIHAAYSENCAASRAIQRQIWSGYQRAQLFLAPQPALPMPELKNLRALGPIARTGVRRRGAVCARLSVPATSRLVLVALGGIPSELPLDSWPCIEDVVWLFSGQLTAARADWIDIRSLPFPFIDVLTSVDAVLTKPGYGTYAEAVCNGVPVLTLARPDWPETPGLNDWARQHGCLEEISPEQFRTGRFSAALAALWQQSIPPPPEPSGIRQAVTAIGGHFPA
ncbi:MAG: hypothetical protein WBN51_04405 [Gammaproteobacteria bacterium]